MTSDIHANPDELRDIARAIREFRFVLNEQSKAMSSQLKTLDWNDQRYVKFCDAIDPFFEIAMNMEDRILEMEHYSEQTAARLDDYLRGA